MVEAGHYLAKSNVTAAMKLMHLSCSVAEHDVIKVELIEHAAIAAAAMKESAHAAGPGPITLTLEQDYHHLVFRQEPGAQGRPRIASITYWKDEGERPTEH